MSPKKAPPAKRDETPSADELAALAAKQQAHQEAEEKAALEAKQKAAEEQERADMEAIGRSFMQSFEIVLQHPDWKDWSPAEDPVELVTDMLGEIDELKAKLSPEPEPVPEGARITPLAWDELPPYSVQGTLAVAAWVLEGAEQSFVMVTEPGHANVPESWGVFHGASDGRHAEILRYAIERRPTPEVLFNKMRELGGIDGTWDELAPLQRASFELAARIVAGVADAIEAINAQIVAKNPPPAPAIAASPVDLEDTIFERVDGMADIDPDLAAARRGADQAAARRVAGDSQAKKTRSIAEGAE